MSDPGSAVHLGKGTEQPDCAARPPPVRAQRCFAGCRTSAKGRGWARYKPGDPEGRSMAFYATA